MLQPRSELLAGSCKYGIMVDSFTTTSRFAFYISDTGEDLVLIEGIPVRAYVPRGQYDYFKFTVPSAHTGETLTITVSVDGGAWTALPPGADPPARATPRRRRQSAATRTCSCHTIRCVGLGGEGTGAGRGAIGLHHTRDARRTRRWALRSGRRTATAVT